MPLNAEFYEIVKPLDRNWSMGVELVSPLLHSLVRCVRPRNVLEIGAGYSTIFLLQSLADNLSDDQESRKKLKGQVRSDEHRGLRRLFKGKHPLPMAEKDYYEIPYTPTLCVIDDSSHPATSALKVMEVARKLRIDAHLKFYEGDFRGMSKKFEPNVLPFDFIWFDCGMLDEFLGEYWDLLNPSGGFLLIHSTLTNPTKLAILNKFRETHASRESGGFEMVSLLEPHKWRQNSLTLIRRLSRRMYRLPEGDSEDERIGSD
jgi:hypothetical protein